MAEPCEQIATGANEREKERNIADDFPVQVVSSFPNVYYI